MGIAIGVELEDNKAQAGLAEINRQLAMLINQSRNTNKLLSGLNTRELKQVSVEAQKTTSALQNLGKVGSGAFSAITYPLRKTVGLLTSMPALLTLTAAGFAAIAAARSFYRISDDLTNIQNRLRLVVDSSTELVRVQHELYRVSRESYSTLKSSSDIYFNLSRSLKSAGGSTHDLYDVTRTLQRTMAISGGSLQSQTAGLIQFNQGLASGVLRGDEFNSVMENLPRLAQLLSEGLGVSQGKLRAMAEEGRVTTDLMLAAIRKEAPKIAKEFAGVTVTAEMGINAVTAAVNNFFTTITSITGSNVKFGKAMAQIASELDSFSSRLVPTLYATTQGLRNYINEIDSTEASTLALRKMWQFKISIFDVYSAYREYSAVKGYINDVKMLLGVAETESKGFFDKVKERTNETLGTRFGIAAPDVEFSFKDFALAGLKLGGAFVHALQGVTSKFSWLIPDIRLPMVTVTNDVKTFIKQKTADMDALAVQIFMPFVRGLEATAEAVTLKNVGDKNLERQWVDLFKSSSVKEFTENLYELGDAGNSIRFQNFRVLRNDTESLTRSGIESAKEYLRYFGILENRLLFINNVRFDRAIEGLRTLGSIAARVYQDVLAPILEPKVLAVYLFVRKISVALADGIRANFTTSAGEALGEKLVEGVTVGIKFLVSKVKRLFERETFSFSFDSSFEKELRAFVSGAKESIIAIFEFAKGFVIGVFDTVSSEIEKALFTPFERFRRKSSDLLSSLFEFGSAKSKVADWLSEGLTFRKIKYSINLDTSIADEAFHTFDLLLEGLVEHSTSVLAKLEKRFAKFGGFISDVFFKVYDKVVGHSYWPDMIDGVNEYTEKLFGSESRIQKFATFVKQSFSGLLDKIAPRGFGDKFSQVFESFNFDAIVTHFRQSLGASILATILYHFGGPIGRFVSLDYFFSSVDEALYGVLSRIPGLVGKVLGESTGILFGGVAASFVTMLDTVIASLPTFVQGFLGTLGPIGDAVAGLLSIGPSNGLLYALIFGTGIYALKSEKGVEKLKELYSGKFNKKSKALESNGISQYIDAIRGGPSNMPAMFSAVLGNNPALLLTGIAAVSTAALNSISLVESALVGVPLMALAIFGKDAGGRLLRETITIGIPAAFRLMTTAITTAPLKAFAILAAGLTATIYSVTDSIGLLKAAIISIPLALAAMPMLKVLPSILSGFSKRIGGSAAKGPLRKAASEFFGSFLEIAKNIQGNAAAYGAGHISLSDMLLTDSSFSLNRVDLKQRFKNLWSEILRFEIRGKTVSDLGSAVGQYASTAASFLKDKGVVVKEAMLKVWDQRSAVVSTVTTMLTTVAASFKGFLATVMSGLRLLGSLLMNKFSIFVILTAGFVTATQAATGMNSMLKMTGSYILDITIGVTALTAALYLLGRTATAINAFSQGKDAFMKQRMKAVKPFAERAGSEARRAAMASAPLNIYEVVDGRGKNRLETPAEQRDRADAAKLKKISEVTGKEAKAAKWTAVGAGFLAAKDSIVETFQQISDAAKWLFEKLWVAAKFTAIYVSAALKRAFAFIMSGQLLTAIRGVGIAVTAVMASAPIAAFGVAWLAVVVAAKAAFSVFTKGGRAAIATFMSSVRTIGLLAATLAAAPAKLAPLIKGLAAIAAFVISIKGALVIAAAAITGVIGYWLFGSDGGDSIFDTLESIKDKVTGLLGINATSGSGRTNQLMSLLEDQDVAKMRVEFSAELSKVDLSKLKEGEFKAIADSATATKDLMTRMNEAYVVQGQLTAEQLHELTEGIKKQKEILDRQPRKVNGSLAETNLANRQVLGETDNSLSTRIGRFVKATFYTVFGGLAAIITGDFLTGVEAVRGGVVWLDEKLVALKDALMSSGLAVGNWISEVSAAAARSFWNPYDMLTKGDKFVKEKIAKNSAAAKSEEVKLLSELNTRFPSMGGVKAEEISKNTLGISPFVKATFSQFNDGFIRLFNDITFKGQSEESSAIGMDILKNSEIIQRVQGGLSPAQIEKFKEAENTYTIASKRFLDFKEKDRGLSLKGNAPDVKTIESALRSSGVISGASTADEVRDLVDSINSLPEEDKLMWLSKVQYLSPQQEIEFQNLEIGMQKARTAYLQLRDELERAGTRGLNIKNYTASINKLAEDAKTAFGMDIGKGGKDFLGDAADEEFLAGKTQAWNSFFNTLVTQSENAGMALRDKLQMARFAKEVAQLKERLDNTIFVRQTLEFQLQVTGVSTSIEALEDFFATQKEEYAIWEQAYKDMRKAQEEYNATVMRGADQESVRSRLQAVRDAKQRVRELAPQEGTFASIRAGLTKLGMPAVADKNWLGFSLKELSELQEKLRRATIAKETFEMPGKRPFGQDLQDLENMLAAMHEAELAMARLRGKQIQQGQAGWLPMSARVENAEAAAGMQMPQEVAARPDLAAKYLAIMNEMTLAENERAKNKPRNDPNAPQIIDFNDPRGEKANAEFNAAQLRRRRQLDKLAMQAELPPDITTSAVLSAISEIGAPFDISGFQQLKADERLRLRNAAVGVMRNKEAQGKYELSPEVLAKQAKEFKDATKFGTELFRKRNKLSVEEERQRFTDTGFEVRNAANLASLSSNPLVKSLIEKLADVRLKMQDKDLPTSQRAPLLATEEEILSAVREMNLWNTGIEPIISKLQGEFSDSNINVDVFERFQDSLLAFVIAMEQDKTRMGQLGNTPEDVAEARSIRKRVAKRTRDTEGQLVESDFIKRGELAMKRVGIDVSSIYQNVSDAADKMLRDASKSLEDEMLRFAEQRDAGVLSNNEVRAGALLIEKKRKALEESVNLAAMRIEDTQAYQAGQQMAYDVRSALGEGIKGVLKGKLTLAEGINGLLDTITSGIIDNFVNGFISSVAGSKGLFNDIFSGIGKLMFQSGADSGGGNGEKSVEVIATENLTWAIQELTARISSYFGMNQMDLSSSTTGSLSKQFGIEGYDFTNTSVMSSEGLSYNMEQFGVTLDEGLRTYRFGAEETVTSVQSMDKNMGMWFSTLIGAMGGGAGKAMSWIMTGLKAYSMYASAGTSEIAMAGGGSIPGNFGAPVPILAHGGEVMLNPEQQRALIMSGDLSGGRKRPASQVFHLNITGDVSRQTRLEIQTMIPQIASGVNAHNYEKGNGRR